MLPGDGHPQRWGLRPPAARARPRARRRGRPALSCGPCRRRLRVPLVLGAGCVGSGGARPRLTPSGSRAAHGSPFLRQPQGRWAGPPSSARASRGPPPAAQWGQRLRPPRGVAGSSWARDRERVPAQLRKALGRPCERPSPASRPSGPAPRHWAGVSVGREWPSVEEAAPEAPGGLEQQPQGPRVPPRPPTAACLQGPSSSPTSSPWPSRGSRSSTWSSPSASGCAEAASGCGRPSRPTWAAWVGASWGPRRQPLREAGLGAADAGGAPTQVRKEPRPQRPGHTLRTRSVP